MKKIIMFSVFLILSLPTVAQDFSRTVEVPVVSAAQAIVDFSDSMRLSFPFYTIERITFDNRDAHQAIYHIYPGRISVVIPLEWNENNARSILGVIDSLALTGSFNNLRIVSEISCRLAQFWNGEADWQTEIVMKAVKLDLDYSARINSFSAVSCLPKALYTPEIVNRIAELFRSPFISREEAEVMAQSRPPIVPLDTTGYAELINKRMTDPLTADENNLFWRIRNHLERVQNSEKTIEQFADSLERERFEFEVSQHEGRAWSGNSSIISSAGSKRIYSLASLIDSFATPEMRQIMHLNSVDDILARLKYKDYPQQQNNKYIHIIDSCILYLKNNQELHPDSVFMFVRTINRSYNNMIYIGMIPPDLHYNMAPLLLVTSKIRGGMVLSNNDISVGAYFLFNRFMRDIENMPVPDGVFLEDWDKHDFPAQMYQWMMENKDNYQLSSNLLNED